MKRMWKNGLSLFLAMVLVMGVVIGTSIIAYANPYPQYNYYNSASDYQIACTWYAWKQANERLGLSLPSWGNAGNWYSAAGYEKGSEPRVNSIACWSYTNSPPYGHVAYVTGVNSDGSISIVEGGSGWSGNNHGVLSRTIKRGTYWPDQGFIYLQSTHTCDYMASATIAKAPTKTATGTRVRTCSCGKTINETIPAIPYTTDIPEGIYTITTKCGSGLKVSTRSIDGYFDVYICDGDYVDQYWLFSKNSDGTYTIRNAYYNRVLDVENIYMFNAGEICASYYNGGNNQKFYIVPFGDGYYKFVAKHSYLNLDNVNASTTAGNGLIQCYDNGSDAQRWALKLSNPSLSLSSSSVNVSAGSSKTVNCTVGRETGGVTSSCSIADTSVCSASWGNWNGMTCPLTITGKAGGTTTVKVTLKDKDTGIVYDTKTITVTVPGAASKPTVKAVVLNDVTVNYKAKVMLQPIVTADENAKCSVKYESSNPNVVSVDANGRVTGVKRGTAIITCTVTDEYGNSVSDQCVVTVSYTAWQWVIIILLFGWIWYK